MRKRDPSTDKPVYAEIEIDAELYRRMEEKVGKHRVTQAFIDATEEYLREREAMLGIGAPKEPSERMQTKRPRRRDR